VVPATDGVCLSTVFCIPEDKGVDLWNNNSHHPLTPQLRRYSVFSAPQPSGRGPCLRFPLTPPLSEGLREVSVPAQLLAWSTFPAFSPRPPGPPSPALPPSTFMRSPWLDGRRGEVRPVRFLAARDWTPPPPAPGVCPGTGSTAYVLAAGDVDARASALRTLTAAPLFDAAAAGALLGPEVCFRKCDPFRLFRVFPLNNRAPRRSPVL